jgi:hypothetical protein
MSRRRIDEVPLNLFSFQDIVTSVSGIIILVVLLLGLRIATSKSAGGASDTPSRVPDRSREVTQAEQELAELGQQLAKREKPPPRTRAAASPLTEAEALRALIATEARLRQELADREATLASAAGANAKLSEEQQRLQEELARIQAQKRDVPADVWLRPDQPTDAPIILAECARTGVRCALWAEKGPGPIQSFAAADLRGRDGFVQHAKTLAARDPRSKLVLLLKPSCMKYAMDLVQELRSAGVAVGYDALEESLELFPRSQP